jgi:Uma2 family endonuclease
MTILPNPTVCRAENVEHWTHEEFMRVAPENHKAELIDGDMIRPSPAFFPHERLQVFLTTVLMMYVSHSKLGYVLGSRYAVYISEDQTYEPDILFMSQERKHIITESKLTAAPDLAVEILSASTARYDRGAKLQNYDRAGLRELWLIDPYGAAGTQFYQQQKNQLVEIASVNGVIHSIALPNFKLKTAWLWANEKDELPNPIDVLKELGII